MHEFRNIRLQQLEVKCADYFATQSINKFDNGNYVLKPDNGFIVGSE